MLEVRGLRKSFADAPVFDAVSLQLKAGEFVALLGESGVGKSTLLNCIAGLEMPDAGQVLIGGHDIAPLAEAERARLRRTQLGFVFQAFHVLPHLNVAENVALPLLLQGRPDSQRVLSVLKPDVHAKGADYADKPIPERAIVEAYGGRVELIPLVPGRSTTDTLSRLAK